MESGDKVENLDVEAAIKLVKVGATKEEIEIVGLDKIILERLYKRGSAPTINTKEVIKRLNEKSKMLEEGKKTVENWMEINENIMEEMKSGLVKKVLEISVREIMKNHMYIFDGQDYLLSE